MPAPPQRGGGSLSGELLRFSYRNEDGSFAVARLRAEGAGEVTVVGPVGHVGEGQHVKLTGRWVEHQSFGRQFRVDGVLIEDPRTRRGLIRYLASGAVHGLGPTFAERVVDRFGLDTLRVIAEEPEKLLEVEGIGRKRMEAIREQWVKDRAHREVMATLRGYGIGAALANRIVEKYGRDAPSVVSQQPFRLCSEVRGVGFRTADAIARQAGIARDDPGRAEAGVVHLLREAEGQGHCFVPRDELLGRAAHLEIPRQQAEPALDRLALEGLIHLARTHDVERQPVYLPELAQAEAAVARGLSDLAAAPPPSEPARQAMARHLAAAEERIGLDLAPGQRAAVELALTHGVAVITGGPGTGKTTIVRVLVEAARRAGEDWLLAAPTGRAARRLAEATGREAKTIHRLLEYNPRTNEFARDLDNPLEAAGVLVDEASMIDVRLMQSLVRAVPPDCRLVLVGDADQLPSVGAGRVLGDVIQSGAVPVATLREVYRQAQDSGIVRNAWRMHQGEQPVSSQREENPRHQQARDFFVVHRRDVRDAQQTLIEVVAERLPKLGFDPLSDVQVLVPMHAGALGTVALNEALQARLNRNEQQWRKGDRSLKLGDRVIQVRNNYDLDVFNGDVGRVVQARSDGVVVDFGEGGASQEVAVTGESLTELELAYAISIHKSQGSEYPAVVIGLHRAHRIMLRRNLLYTAVTRARRFCCIVGDAWAIEQAVNTPGGHERWTRLSDRLAVAT